ncbi:RAB6A-GEF complex partner protein 1 [Holothuria leucospilota]|uniref:Protein RIC1 homolog n=1 Tax=Holothuria leucospilota TaxID=206669 RepID=A0A9Q1C8B0_HOLLE|nr:RAB6A-GEF complex partner protein 1 [Holothuria leucospilota]
MYFPVGWPKILQLPTECNENLLEVVANRDRTLFAVITTQSIHIWQCKPCVLITSYRRSADSCIVLGFNVSGAWRPDTSAIAISTTGGHLLLFRVHHADGERMYASMTNSSHHYKRDTTEADTIPVPLLRLAYSSSIGIPNGITCVCCLKDDMLVASPSGMLHRVTWNGNRKEQLDISIRSVPFSLDLEHSRESQLDDPHIHCKHLRYSQTLGLCATVLSDGRAAVLTTESPRFLPKNVRAVWAPDVKHATCVAVNSNFRLVAFGLANGQGIVFTVDEITGALLLSHQLTLSTSDYPEGCRRAGPVTELKWTPDSSALVLSWGNGGFSLWSVFGALLLCTLGSDFKTSFFGKETDTLHVRSMEWGPEGYSLWLTTKAKSNPSNDQREVDESQSIDATGQLLQLPFVKSALTTNPVLTNHEHLFLQGEDRLYLNSGDALVKCSPEDEADGKSPVRQHVAPSSLCSFGDNNSTLMGSKHWSVIQIPQSYLASNWPLKFAVVDKSGHCLAVAGRFGFAHCALFTKRWKLFGNITQEKDMSVTGGLAWWRDFIVCACYNHYEHRDEIRVYPRISNLDNAFAFILKVPYPVLLLNVFKDYLITYCSDCHISIFRIERGQSAATPVVSLTWIQGLSMVNFVPSPTCMVSVMLTSLRSETAKPSETNNKKDVESLIINTAGRVLMLQRERSTSENGQLDRRKKENEINFCSPVVLASAVESMWATAKSSKDKPHLMEALWLGCGASGMKVWLPLFPQEGEQQHHSFLSKRIMLPFRLRIYPLAVLFEDAVVLGSATDIIHFDAIMTPTPGYDTSRNPCQFLPFTTLERTTQVYLHHILRQLLRRNLGIHALQIARSCTSLPYFPHVLELMLHEVLEEEATASEPIPDALLPRVIAFIQEFPEYHETVVHCARKTEIALWGYLFDSVGSPQQLFEQCLSSGCLHTAASYLIIIQNLEPVRVSRQHATLLLDAALEKCEWQLCRDILRFLRSIGPGDVEPSRTPPPVPNPNYYPLSPKEARFQVGASGGQRSRSMSQTSGKGGEKSDHASLKRSSSSKPTTSAGASEEQTADEYYMDIILNRHARKLFANNRIRDLGMFAAHVDFKLVDWLIKESVRAGKVEDFVTAIKKLHADFSWPYPELGDVPLAKTSLKSMNFGVLSINTSEPYENGVPSSDKDSGQDTADTSLHVDTYPTRPTNLRIERPQSLLSVPSSEDMKSQDVALKHPSTKGSDDTPSFGTMEPSESSSTFDGDVETLLEDSFWNNSIGIAELEQFYLEVSRSGPPQSEKELRYMLQVMMEAGCLEWALIISIVLRDLGSISRVVNTVSFTKVPLEIMGRMREGLSFLELWADSECPGYKPLMLAAKPQTRVLTEVVETTTSPPSPRPHSSASSDHSVGHLEIKRYNSLNNSQIGELINGEDEVFGKEEEAEEVQEGQCRVS